MRINIDDEQQAVLLDLINSRLSNLPAEIRHTDNPEFRQGLRDERELLLSVVQALSPTAARASGQ